MVTCRQKILKIYFHGTLCVCVDLVGPYSLKAKVRQLDGKVIEQEIKLLAMTFIDPATGWFEWAQVIDDKALLQFRNYLIAFG